MCQAESSMGRLDGYLDGKYQRGDWKDERETKVQKKRETATGTPTLKRGSGNEKHPESNTVRSTE